MKRTLVFHLGCDAGFFSEYNNMLLAIEFCEKHKISFSLYSDDANFGFEKGWQDYFLPFCAEVHESFHHELNYRFPEHPSTVLLRTFCRSLKHAVLRRDLSLVKYLRPFADSRQISNIKKKYNFSYFTQDMWDDFHHYVNPCVSDVCVGGVITLHEYDAKIWRYNGQTAKAVSELVDRLCLPDEYVSIHIRRGDKIEESRYFDVEEYMHIIVNNTDCKSVFVATDDCSVLDELMQKYPRFTFYSNVKASMKGHQQGYYNQAPKQWKKEQMMLLLADVEILSKSKFFVGSYRSNIGQYLMIRRLGQKCAFVDFAIS